MDTALSLPLVQLVQLGFLGFAVAMMSMAFYALIRVTMLSAEIPEKKLAVMSKTIIFFLGGSLFAIVLGIVYAVLSPEVNVYFDVDKRVSSTGDIKVRIAGRELGLPDENTVILKDGSEVTIDLTILTDRVGTLQRQTDKLDADVEQLKANIKALNSQRAAEKQSQIEAVSSELLLRRESGF